MDRLDCDRMFIAVMETGSFAAAALRMNTSSGQASKLVARLEQDWGVRLINRTTRALSWGNPITSASGASLRIWTVWMMRSGRGAPPRAGG